MNTAIKILVLAGSAGSFNVIFDIVKTLPLSFNLPILIVIHRGQSLESNIDDVLNSKSNIFIREITDKETILDGIAYLCPPDYHVLIEPEKIFSLDKSEKVWYSRPSIDIAFESVTEIYGDAVLAVLFSGSNGDGAEGLLKIKENGGITIVQDPKEAEFKTMPQAAIAINAAHEILDVIGIKERILKLTGNNE